MATNFRKSASSKLVFSFCAWTLVIVGLLFALIGLPKSPSLQSSQDKEALLSAAAAGSYKQTSKYLKQGVKPNIRDSEMRTPLHLAAANGNKATVKLLLSYEENGWYADGHTTPMHLAAGYGNTEAVKLIAGLNGHNWYTEKARIPNATAKLKEALGPNFDNQLQEFYATKTLSARELAVIYGHQSAVLSIPTSSRDDFLDAFSCACMLGDVEMVEVLWHHHQERSWWYRHRSLQKHVAFFPAPPFHLAVMSGNRATVAFLLEKGFPATKISSKKLKVYPPYSSSAHYAAIVGSTKLLSMLERYGVDLTDVDYLHRTPLSYAVEHLNNAAVEFLVKQNYPDETGRLSSTSSKSKSSKYLGKGDKLVKNASIAASISSGRIKKALESLGIVVPLGLEHCDTQACMDSIIVPPP